MDSLDQELIALLRADARASIATLAHKLDVSRGTITNRIARLEDEGVIVGYTVRLRPDVQTEQITAWTSITVDGNQAREVIRHLLGEPGVAAIHDTNGRWDLLAELRSASLNELAAVLERRMGHLNLVSQQAWMNGCQKIFYLGLSGRYRARVRYCLVIGLR